MPDTAVADAATIARVTDAAPPNPMKVAEQYVALQRQENALKLALREVKDKKEALEEQLKTFIETEQFPRRAEVDGATVFDKTTLRCSARDHKKLAAALDKLGLDELKPSTVNAQRLTSYVKEQLQEVPLQDPDTGELRTLEQRLRLALPAELVDHIKAHEQYEVVVNGAGQ